MAPVDTRAIIARLQQVLDAPNDALLGKALGVGTSTVSNWRQRNSPPYAQCVEVAMSHGVSLDWLIFGIGGRVPALPGEAVAVSDDRLDRMARFLHHWNATRGADERAWLEQQLLRNVPEYREWTSEQA